MTTMYRSEYDALCSLRGLLADHQIASELIADSPECSIEELDSLGGETLYVPEGGHLVQYAGGRFYLVGGPEFADARTCAAEIRDFNQDHL